jgi:hypothetical protein
VWYPSGGFGHFVNAVLTLHGVDFVRPKTAGYSFNNDGNSHRLPLVAPKFLHNPKNYKFNFDRSELTYSLLVDNGIDDEGTDFIDQFPDARVIKICYSDTTWPIVASTLIHKAMGSSLERKLPVDVGCWPEHNNWAVREKYFLFLKDHQYRSQWRASFGCYNINIEDFLDYRQFVQSLKTAGIELLEFDTLWQQWRDANAMYIEPTTIAKQIIAAVKSNQSLNINNYTDLWTQAVVNYYIWLEYDYVVPANDYADWFDNTDQIRNMLNHA